MKYRVTGTYSWRMKWISSHSKRVDEIIEADSRQAAIDKIAEGLTEDSSIHDDDSPDGEFYDDEPELKAAMVDVGDEAEQAEIDERKRAYAAMKRFATPLFAVWEVDRAT